MVDVAALRACHARIAGMADQASPFALVMQHPVRFLWQVLSAFRDNQGLLLAGAVAYYTLLSIVPMFALLLILLSQFLDQQLLLDTVGTYLELAAPTRSGELVDDLAAFLSHWKVVGVAGVLFLLFFSSLAFTVLENAMALIFFHRVDIRRRHFLVSAIIPYVYIGVLAVGLLTVSLIAGWLAGLGDGQVTVFGYPLSVTRTTAITLYLFGVFGEILLLTSLYLVMPVGRLAWSHALIGGIAATVLWEITRHLLVWYLGTLSFVNIIYGSLATTIVILLSLEFAAIILLLGAQVIAEYERLGQGPQLPDGPQ
jgi:YihY family inner membrane protein